MEVDVAIIGGGPGGSTAGSFLRKYGPDLRVAIFERERFPREHVGESQLPPISAVLDEMGCYEAIESAGFPIKIGATYRWGSSTKLWDFEFMPLAEYKEEPRPRRFAGQASRLAFQVDRAVYDDILLKHAESLGCEVLQETAVLEVLRDGDTVRGLRLADGRTVQARHYVDASGGTGILRRAMGVEVDAPTKLRNVAFWDYWENAEWAMRYEGGATRVLVLSIGAGWIWFIPLSPTRTSIGFVCPAEYYRSCGKKPEEIYSWALSQEPLIAELTAKASRESEVRGTKDWSFLADRMAGENWMLVGESAGFADPILAAGLTLTHTGAREAAFTILELDRGELEASWLKEQYEDIQKKRIGQHIRFADFWYSANGIFTDLQSHTVEIAKDAGLDLDPQKAFQWLGTGGFTFDNPGQVGIGGLDLAGARQVAQIFLDSDAPWEAARYNVFRLALDGAQEQKMATYSGGRVHRSACYVREGKRLPMVGLFALVVDALRSTSDAKQLLGSIERLLRYRPMGVHPQVAMHLSVQVLEVLVGEGWVSGRFDPRRPRLTLKSPREGEMIHTNVDLNSRLEGLSKPAT